MKVKFDYDPGRRQGIIVGDCFQEVRERFSVKNPGAQFARMRGRYIPPRIYAITPGGRFDVGLGGEIHKYIEQTYSNSEINLSENFINVTTPKYDRTDIPKLKLKLRDYQEDIIKECLNHGRGVVVLATAGGKTLTIATLLEHEYKNDPTFKCALIVPDLGLVEQTVNDFNDYGCSFTASKWTGKNPLNLSSNVIVCNLGILQSKNSDVSWLEGVDMCIVDEVHKLRRGNKVNKLFKAINTPHIFGFTGTMPEELIDQWNIVGKIGSIIYERNSYELRKDKYISDVKVQVLELDYATQPTYPRNIKTPSERYRVELDFIIHNEFRNNILSGLCNKFNNNALLLVDYIEHGTVLHNHLTNHCSDKKVYFIRGEVALEDRERVKQIMEMEDNVIVVAISKIFSTGINIKNLHYIIFASGGKAKIKTIQSIGRGLRLHKDKAQLIIFDIGDNLRYGRDHLNRRIAHYQKENIEYGSQKIIQKIN